MTRKIGTFYWTYKHFASRNFKTLTSAKTNLLKEIKRNSNIAGRNSVYYVKSSLQDLDVGHYGISKEWHSLNRSLY